MSETRLLTLTQASKAIPAATPLKPRLLRDMIRRGALEGVKIGGRYYLDAAKLPAVKGVSKDD